MSAALLPRRFKRRLLFRVLDPKGIQWHGVPIPRGEILAASPRGGHAHIKRWLAARRIEPVTTPANATPGVCSRCRCTHADPCPGGCAWITPTLCSACLGK